LVLAVLLFLLLSPGFRRAASAIPAQDPAAGLDNAAEDSLQAELSRLKGRYRDTLLACRPVEPEPPPEDEPLTLPDPERVEEPPPSAGDAPLAREAAAPPPPPPEPEPEPEPVQEPDKPKPKPKPAPKPSKPKPKPGGRLEIPEGATDVSFLEGCWKSDAGLTNNWGQPVLCYYCFSGSGKASMRVEEVGRGSGRKCTASATAKLTGGGLTIRDTGARCGAGPSYVPSTIRCTPSKGGAANCRVQSDGRPSMSTRITRQ
jgi:hypothetical protein